MEDPEEVCDLPRPFLVLNFPVSGRLWSGTFTLAQVQADPHDQTSISMAIAFLRPIETG